MRKFLAMPWNRQNTLFSRETVPLSWPSFGQFCQKCELSRSFNSTEYYLALFKARAYK
jgi:hypothetical protein